MTTSARARRPSVTLVVGMHRSGTSLAASVLAELGVAFSDDLIEANEYNPHGYYESRTITEFHDRLLAELDSSWRSPATAKPFPAQWWRYAQFAPFGRELEAIVREECARAGGRWGVKDPRASRLLPLWNEVLERAGAEASYVLAVRDPGEVAGSLLRRDGMDRELSDLLWLEHNVAALVDGGARVAAVVPYAQWFDDGPAAAAAVARAAHVRATPARLRAVLAGVVDTGLGNRARARPSPLPYVDALYASLASDRDGLDDEVGRVSAAMRLARSSARISEAEGRPHHAISIHQISQRLSWRQDVSEEAAGGHVDAPDAETRRTARLARSRTSIRRALADAVRAAEVDDFQNQLTLSPVQYLAEIADVDTPFLDVLRHQAVQQIAHVEFASAVRLLDELFRRAFATGMRAGPFAARALANLTHPDVLAACATIARAFAPESLPPAGAQNLIAIVWSPDDAALLERVRERERRLVAAGYGVIRIPSRAVARPVRPEEAAERLAWLVGQLTIAPVPVALFMTHAQDVVARIASLCLPPGLAVWEDPLASPAPDALFVAMPELLDDAEPMTREVLGLAPSDVLLTTVGRLEKFAHPQYLDALSRVLLSNENAWLAIAGSGDATTRSLIFTSFDRTVRNRLIFAEPKDWRSLLKASDVYCDAPPWNGTRGPLAAGYLGVPIAAFVDPALRPRPAAKAILGRAIPSAATPGEFRDIIEAYIRDPDLRARHGEKLKTRVRIRFGPEGAARRLVARLPKAAPAAAQQSRQKTS